MEKCAIHNSLRIRKSEVSFHQSLLLFQTGFNLSLYLVCWSRAHVCCGIQGTNRAPCSQHEAKRNAGGHGENRYSGQGSPITVRSGFCARTCHPGNTMTLASFSLPRMLAVFIKEFQQMMRDRLTFAMAVGVPIILDSSVERARVGCWRRAWVVASTLNATAYKEEQHPQTRRQ